MQVTSRNALFQQWSSYLTNRTKRSRAGVFLVQGVRPITLATEQNWPIATVLFRAGGGRLSDWATGILRQTSAQQVGVSEELIAELGEKDSGAPEIVLVAEQRQRALEGLPLSPAPLVVVVDRLAYPGNLGTLIRSADAFGADGLITTGHAADPYDPACVRASTGSLFGLPVVSASGADEVIEWRERRAAGERMSIVGLDETGAAALFDEDLTRGLILVVGNETRGMSRAWREGCDRLARIPIGGQASSLGAPSAGAVALYEVSRQRTRI